MKAWMWTAGTAASLVLGGCAMPVSTYDAYTTGEHQSNMNAANCERVMVSAVSYVAARYPAKSPDGVVAINLPPSIRKTTYERIAETIGPNVRPLTPDLAATNVPTYHVSRVWIRNDQAKVDVIRPMTELPPSADGKFRAQCIVVHLEGGLKPWQVRFADPREPGLAIVPPPYYLPDNDDPDQYKSYVRERIAAKTPKPEPAPQQRRDDVPIQFDGGSNTANAPDPMPDTLPEPMPEPVPRPDMPSPQ